MDLYDNVISNNVWHLRTTDRFKDHMVLNLQFFCWEKAILQQLKKVSCVSKCIISFSLAYVKTKLLFFLIKILLHTAFYYFHHLLILMWNQ